MRSKCFFLVAFAFLGAYSAPAASTAPLGVNNIDGGVGPTVSETLITPYHRTDFVATPCGRSVVRTTALPVVSYRIPTEAGFLGTAAGIYPGGFAETGAFPGAVAEGFAGTGGFYPGLVAGGLGGTTVGVYPRIGVVAGAGIVSGGLGAYPAGNVVV